MSAYSGPQGKGASKARRSTKHAEAVQRRADLDARFQAEHGMTYAEWRAYDPSSEISDPAVEILLRAIFLDAHLRGFLPEDRS